MARIRTRTQDARFKGLVMLGLAVAGLVAGGVGQVPLLLTVGGIALLLGLVFLVASSLMRD